MVSDENNEGSGDEFLAGENEEPGGIYIRTKRPLGSRVLMPAVVFFVGAAAGGYFLLTMAQYNSFDQSLRAGHGVPPSIVSTEEASADISSLANQEPAAGEATPPATTTTTTESTTTDVTAAPGDAPAATTTTTTTTTTATPPGVPPADAGSAPATAAVTEVPAEQAPAMPPALAPEQATDVTAGVPDMAKTVSQETAKQAAPAAAPAAEDSFPAIGGGAAPAAASTTTTTTTTTAPVAAPNTPTPAPGEAAGTANAPVTPQSAAASGPDVYYDAGVPTGPLSNSVGPRKVDPTQEPASQFVVVTKDSGPGGTSAQITAAERALKLGHYDAALDMFEKLYAKNSRDQRILMGRAVAMQNLGRTEGALQAYDQLLDVHPDNVEALVNMLGLMRKQYPEVALRRLMNLHDKYPNNALIVGQIGVTEGDQLHVDEAVHYLNMAMSMEPNNAQHQFNLGVVLDRAGRKSDAIKYYEQALETDSVYGGGHSVPREKIYDRLALLRRQ